MSDKDFFGKTQEEVLVQERIYGTEYIVNTLTSNGKHRLNTVLRYRKEKTEEGGYIYDYCEYITKLEAGHAEMVDYAFKVADAIHYQNGMIHGEYMIDDKGPVLIEVNCRPMGATQPAEFMDLITGQLKYLKVYGFLAIDAFESSMGKIQYQELIRLRKSIEDNKSSMFCMLFSDRDPFDTEESIRQSENAVPTSGSPFSNIWKAL